MRVLHTLKDFPQKTGPVFLAIGCFDGLHIGHRAVIQKALHQAHLQQGVAWVLTFSPHPAQALDPQHAPPLIHAPSQFLRGLQEIGLHGTLLHPFNKSFIQTPPDQFLNQLLEAIPHLGGICVGEDWSFGKDRAGNIDLLADFCKKNNLHFTAVPPICWKGERVSSTRIREAIRLGHLHEATAMLGAPLATIGTVTHGEKIGRKLGFPTANINPENQLLPPRGIYAAQLRIGQHLHPAAAYIGHRGTFHQNQPQVLEVHLIDHPPIDLYDAQVELLYLEYIRPDRIFKNPDKLIQQIKLDLTAIRTFF